MRPVAAPALPAILSAMRALGYRVFGSPSGHDLNIVGIRTPDTAANDFNDWLCAFYPFAGRWNHFAFPATTDPGRFYRENPMHVDGTAVMKPGQYRGAYKVGLHRGYPALEQKGPITVYRDADRNETIDTTGAIEDTGIHAVNIHRAGAGRASLQVNRWSAGCQVFQDPDHFDFFMALCRRAARKHGNSFTYTLLEVASAEV